MVVMSAVTEARVISPLEASGALNTTVSPGMIVITAGFLRFQVLWMLPSGTRWGALAVVAISLLTSVPKAT